MITKCECNDCLLKDLCVNRNQRLKNIDGPDHFYVQLSCNHLHPGKIIHSFKCDVCRNKCICYIFNDGNIVGNRLIDHYLSVMNTECLRKLNTNAFQAILQCKGYQPE